MKVKRFMLSFGVLLFLVTFSTACNDKENNTNNNTNNNSNDNAQDNLNESGMPIVNDQIEFNFFAGKSPQSPDDWDDIMIWNEYGDMTNIDIEWNLVQDDSLDEKRNLALGSGSLPDVFYAAQIPNTDLLKYGEQGTIIKLNDLIDKYAPNLKSIMEEDPNIEKSITFPDGNIYSLPSIHAPEFLSLRTLPTMWYNEEWLNELDMEIPQTTEEYYQFLKSVKEQDLLGNGEDDEIPFGSGDINFLVGWLKGAFGVGNRGHSYIDMDPQENEVRFFPISDEYKDMLQYINKLYDEELIEQNIFSIETEQFIANGTDNRYGSMVYWSPEAALGDIGANYVSAVPLVGPNDDQLYVTVTNPVYSMGNFAITDENENPEAAVRWADYFYSDEGTRLFHMGIEGETYEETSDGEYKYLDKITNSEDGLTQTQELAKYLVWTGIGAPGVVKPEYFEGSENNDQSLEAADKLEPYLIEEVWTNFTYTESENKKLDALSADIENYVGEMQDKFIVGDIPFSEWDDYIKTIEKMGLEEYMEIQTDAYERYEDH